MNSRPSIAYIGVGSNIEPERNIPRAMDLLMQHTRVTGTSTFYRTAPIGPPGQPDYINGVWRIETTASPRDMKFGVLRRIEQQLGRVRSQDKCAPRTIDLDVLLWGRTVLDDPDCRLPAREIRTRPFLVTCLLELDSDLVLPDTDQVLASLVERDDAGTFEPVAELTRHLRSRLNPVEDRSGGRE